MNDGVTGDDRGYLYGDGLFETVRVEDGRPRFIKRHRRRFERSSRTLGYPDEAVEAGLAALEDLEGRDDGLWRVTVTRPGDGVFGGGSGSVSMRRRDLPDAPAEVGLEVTILDHWYFPADHLAEHKTTSWLRSVEALRRARADGYDEVLLASPEGRIGEAGAANIFIRIGGGWVTPPVEGILPGVVRETLLERAARAGLSIEERPVFVGDLQTCESLALTSTGRLVTAVATADNHALETAPVGELAELLEERR